MKWLRKMSIAVAIGLSFASLSFGEADVNAVAAFYSDGTYRLEDWDSLAELRSSLTVVDVLVFHVQTAGPGKLPNIAGGVGTANWVGLIRTSNKLCFPRVVLSPEEANEACFTEFEQTQELDLPRPKPAAAAIGSAAVRLPVIDPSDPDFDDLDDCITTTFKLNMRDDLVPSSGSYFDFGSRECIGN